MSVPAWSALYLWLLCVSGVPTPVSAEVYQWRDEQGKLHFSDKKPRQHQVEDISRRLGKINVDQSRPEQEKLQRLFKPETPAEKAHLQRKQQQQSQQQAKRQRQCQQAQAYLTALRGRVYFEREDGTTYDLSEVERQLKAAELERQIGESCS